MPLPLPSEVENPFNMVYDALWRLVERNPNLTDWINPGNREKFDPERTGVKRSISTADTPELVLISQVFTGNLIASSSSTRLTKSYSWIVTTGDQRLNRILNQISWELFRSLTDWDSELCQLQWLSKNFILQAVMSEGADVVPGEALEENRGILGWTTVWNIDVQMQFDTSDLRIVL